MGYLTGSYPLWSQRAWDAIQKKFITTNPDGTLTLHGTVKVGGLGGKPYRAGDYNYYIHEPVVDQDKKGVGAFLLAGSEMEQSATQSLGRGKTALVDAWFNSQTRKNALGQTELYHYKWDDDSASGYSLFGRAFESYGAHLATLAVVDPWVYNEYADGRKLRQYDGFEAAMDLARWAVSQSR
jgi:unsaturated rhamnogalacturonyl hydrolase